MTRLFAILLACVIAAPAAAGWERVSSKSDLAAQVVGNKYIEPKTKAWFQLKQDGTLAGGFEGKALTGKWKWRGKRVCYSRELGGEKLPNDCIAIHVDGKNLNVTRKSNGSSVQYVQGR